MPLLKNPIQPYFPDTRAPLQKDCGEGYCYPVAAGDISKIQFYQTPCAGNIVCDPTFEDFTLGPELVTNGSFTGSAAGWTLGVNWTYSSNSVTYAGLSPFPRLTQIGLGLVAGTLYRVSFDVNVGVGSVVVTLGDGAGSIASEPITQSGSYSFNFYYTDSDDEINFEAYSLGNVITIDNVSVKEVTMTCWSGSGWSFNDSAGTACKTEVGSASNLINGSTDYLTSGDYYQVSVTIDGYGGGAVQLYVDDGTDSTATNVQTAITGNGTYTYWITALQDGVIGFDPNAAFIGCISGLIVQRLRNDYVFELINEAGDSIQLIDIEYDKNWITLNIDWSTLKENGQIDYGCFTIYAYDACLISGDNLLTDGDFDNQDYTEWTRNMNPYQYNFDGNGVEFILEPLEGPNLVSNSDFASGTTGWTGFAGGDWIISGGGAQHVPGNTTPLVQSITLAAPIPAPNSLFTWHEITVTFRTAGGVTINIGGTNSNTYIFNDQMANLMILTVGGAQNITITPTSNFDGTIDNIKVHQTANAWNNLPQLAHTPIPELIAANYNVDFTITSNIQDGVTGLYVQMDYNNPAQQGLVTGANSTTFMGYVPTMQMVRLSGQFRHVGGYYKLGRVAIDDVSVYQVEPFEATYQSECFHFKEVFPDTQLVTAYCDRDALGSTFEDDFSFESTGFVLQMRVNLRSFNADVDKEVNVAKYSDGSARVTYAQIEKYWQLITDYMSESALTALGAMAHCDHFMIGDTGVDDQEYVVTVERFTPQWRSEGDYALAPALLSLRTKNKGMQFNRHTD